MKRKLEFVAIALFVTLSQILHAQKVKRETLDATLIHYPIIALPTSFTTYSVQPIPLAVDSIEFNRIVNPKKKIVLQSFKLISSTADMNIRVRYGNIKMYEYLSSKLIRSINDLKGMSVDAMIEYTIDVNFEVLDNRGLVIQKETYVNGSTFTSDQSVTIPRRQCKATDALKS